MPASLGVVMRDSFLDPINPRVQYVFALLATLHLEYLGDTGNREGD